MEIRHQEPCQEPPCPLSWSWILEWSRWVLRCSGSIRNVMEKLCFKFHEDWTSGRTLKPFQKFMVGGWVVGEWVGGSVDQRVRKVQVHSWTLSLSLWTWLGLDFRLTISDNKYFRDGPGLSGIAGSGGNATIRCHHFILHQDRDISVR